MINLPNDFPKDLDDIDLWDIDLDLDFSSFGCLPNLSIDLTFYNNHTINKYNYKRITNYIRNTNYTRHKTVV